MGDGSQSHYELREPHASLRGIARCFWRHKSQSRERSVERIPPDGCAELIVNLAGGYFELTGSGDLNPQPAALFAGQITRPLTLVAEGPVHTIGLRFEPDGARGFFGASMRKATNMRVPLYELFAEKADALLVDLKALDQNSQQARLESFVRAAIGERRAADASVAAAVRRISEGGEAEIDGLSQRQAQRRFLDCVGVSMREFQSILRFRRIFDAIEAEPNWARSALAAGYFDQAQMARDFRRYLGCTASEWAQQKTGLSASIAFEASQSYKPDRL